MTGNGLLIERHSDGVAVLTLNRPDKRNALDAALRQALIDTLHDLADDEEIKAVVLTGAGGSFCAGFDLGELMSAERPDEIIAHATTYHHTVYTFPKPMIAAIEGAAVAGGLDLALMCDLRVAASDAKFGQPQVKMGVPAAFDLVATVVPESAARDLCLTGRVITTTEATDIGLINRTVDPGGALAAARVMATEIASVTGAIGMKQSFVAAQPQLFTSPGDES